MQNHVTEKTAQRLKDAGFPQPPAIRGQSWYAKTDDSFIVYAVNDGRFSTINEDGVRIVCADGDTDLIFAPTATDILRELGRDWQLEYFDAKECWEVAFFFRDSSSGRYTAENPAEAAALAWLSIHEK